MTSKIIKEYTEPLTTPINADRSIFTILEDRAERTPEDTLIEYHGADGSWQHFTALEFKDKVVALAKGLIARGIMPGDSVGIIAHTSWQWTALDLAIMSIGAVTVPVYETNSPAQVRMIFNDSHVRMAFAEDDGQRDKIESVRQECPELGDVYVIAIDALDAIETFGKGVSDREFYERAHAVKGDDLATIVYTSGSTGTPKGIELSHGNFVFIVMSGTITMPDVVTKPGRRLWLFLPLAHVFARYMQYVCFAGNVTLGLSSNFKSMLADFHAFKPTFVLAVPRVFEKIYNAASQKAGKGTKGRIFARATNIARAWSRAQQSGSIPVSLRIQHAIYNQLVYKQIMDVFGGQCEYAVCGGAPLDMSIAHFFNGVGLPLLEGYGMTETCAPACVNPTVGYRIGTLGKPFQGVSFAVADDDELYIKSPAVCIGYHNHPEITKSQIVDGWLHTGDLGDISEDGYIKVTGRKKDIIITAGGKNMSPGEVEASVMTSPVVDQCVVIGDRKPFIAALVTIDLADANAWLESQGAEPCKDLDEASRNPIIYSEVERAVNKANELVSRAESIRKFEILPDTFTEQNGMLTASLKARRQAIVEHYKDLIDHQIYVPRKK
ncbi:AMP-dependent synthetase/ligase [Bifidobacterium thermacidophilum]|uniref:Acyl-CoA synthetase n=1 Tax=Bifidobacterium thermacidophilum subsp. thermacidophilum TaxID=79262 RepID=A0A087E197_9BIFI|nr:AMP-dependent synthetase/ligase [Bifidobacterium thermacidophilum]KFJ01548.1 long-chain-fatty-acid--CoA ligase FadD1 [Bifidobacterium thermacidophilum subsp. thermacidophilum]